MSANRARRTSERPTAKEFIHAWQTSTTVREVARKTGLTKDAIRTRACRYRQLGVPLKPYDPVPPPNWNDLAEYATELLAGQPDTEDAPAV